MSGRIGFTGSQRGMTREQRLTFRRHLGRLPHIETFHHGDCIGADAQAHDVADERGIMTIAHPPTVATKRAFKTASVTRKPRPYIERNRRIVDESDEIIATPAEFEEQLRSGTWSTVRYARRTGKPVTIIFPDGSTSRTTP